MFFRAEDSSIGGKEAVAFVALNIRQETLFVLSGLYWVFLGTAIYITTVKEADLQTGSFSYVLQSFSLCTGRVRLVKDNSFFFQKCMAILPVFVTLLEQTCIGD